MKNFSYLFLFFLILGLGFQSCDDSETYADLRRNERKNIQRFIEEHNINVITESEFLVDTVTDVSNNEYVLFEDNGVYMQIENIGEGERMQSGDWKELLVRFWEVYVESGDTTSVSNWYELMPDVLMCRNSSGSFTASFTSGNMYSYYGSAVPTGWLVPLSYINLSKTSTGRAKVKLIVPHGSGHSDASSSVYACYYEITYQEW